MKINLLNQQDEIALDLVELKKISGYVCGKFDNSQKSELNIILVTLEEMKRLNSLYRNINKSTDVLSFSYMSGQDGFSIKSIKDDDSMIKDIPDTVGEIFISPAVALDNSRNQKGEWSLINEMLLLIIHGTLHVYGYGHENDSEAMEMFGIQESLFNDTCSKFGL